VVELVTVPSDSERKAHTASSGGWKALLVDPEALAK
jgi:hypothetical protein